MVKQVHYFWIFVFMANVMFADSNNSYSDIKNKVREFSQRVDYNTGNVKDAVVAGLSGKLGQGGTDWGMRARLGFGFKSVDMEAVEAGVCAGLLATGVNYMTMVVVGGTVLYRKVAADLKARNYTSHPFMSPDFASLVDKHSKQMINSSKLLHMYRAAGCKAVVAGLPMWFVYQHVARRNSAYLQALNANKSEGEELKDTDLVSRPKDDSSSASK